MAWQDNLQFSFLLTWQVIWKEKEYSGYIKKKKHPQLNFVNFLVFFFIYRTIEVFFIYKNYSVSQKELDPNF